MSNRSISGWAQWWPADGDAGLIVIVEISWGWAQSMTNDTTDTLPGAVPINRNPGTEASRCVV